MRREKMGRLLALTLAVALVAAACGDDDESGNLEGATIEVMASWAADSTEGMNFGLVIDEFEAQTGVTVTYTGVPQDLTTVLSTRLDGETPPDVVFLPAPGLLADLAGRDALVDIEDEVGDLVDEHYAPVWRELGSSGGTLYGVWFKGANKSTVWYDPGQFADAGVTAPTTWEEWVQVSTDLTDAGTGALAVGGGDGWTLSDWFENAYLRVAGPEMYDSLTTGGTAWTDQSVYDTLDFLGQILNDDNIVGGTARGLEDGFVASVNTVFASGEAAVVYEGDFVAGVIIGETDAEPGTGFDFFDWPSMDGSPAAVMGGGDVAVALNESDAAFEFLRFLAQPESAAIWAAEGGFSSMNQSLDVSVYPDDITRRAAAALAQAEVFRFDMSDLMPAAFGSTVGAGFWGGLQAWLANPGNVDAILAQMESEAASAHGG